MPFHKPSPELFLDISPRFLITALFSVALPACTGEEDPGSSSSVSGSVSTTAQEGVPKTTDTSDATGAQTEGDSEGDTSWSEATFSTTGGNSETGSSGSTTSPPPSCGDGLLDMGEVCDDGDQVNDNECSNLCQYNFCGDGVVQAGLGEECEPVLEAGCSVDCLQGNVMFLTPEVYAGIEVGGRLEADEKCNAAAEMLGLDDYFKAWLADSTGSPAVDFTHSKLPYIDFLTHQVVAYNWGDLTTCEDDAHCLQYPISSPNENKYGVYWSNVGTDGQAFGLNHGHCINWQGAFDDLLHQGYVGRFGKVDVNWTTWQSPNVVPWHCFGEGEGDKLPLLCVQQ